MESDLLKRCGDQTATTREQPIVTASFAGYVPPRDVVRMVQRMIDSVPEKYLRGLGEVVLTNTEALTRSRRRQTTKSRGKKVHFPQTRGLYHPAFKNRPAWIEIFVDRTLNRWSTGISKYIAWLREVEIADVLFHEIGHHIHSTARPEYREPEDVADVWKVRLQRAYNRRRYRWLGRIVRWFHIDALTNRWHEKAAAGMLARGHISRGEYEESVKAPPQEAIDSQ